MTPLFLVAQQKTPAPPFSRWTGKRREHGGLTNNPFRNCTITWNFFFGQQGNTATFQNKTIVNP